MFGGRLGLLGWLPFSMATFACSGDPGGAVPLPSEWEEVARDARLTYADIVFTSYEDARRIAGDLDFAGRSLAFEPIEEEMPAAREAWVAAREWYNLTEVYRFYGGPIDDSERLIGAWPLDESYIDYVDGDLTAGIVNDVDQELTAENLTALNEAGGEQNVSLGYHAIEFLLWGQDVSDTGAGDRPFTDYVTGGTAENQARRGEYLFAAGGALFANLTDLVDAWDVASATNYRAEFMRIAPEESLERMLTGMTVLLGTELAGKWLGDALEAEDQEAEHSCFSDNTREDVIFAIQGVLNVWNGSTTRLDGSEISGMGVFDVVLANDRSLADELDGKLEECLELANALEAPFDGEIAPGNDAGHERVSALIAALEEASALFDEAFTGFGLDAP